MRDWPGYLQHSGETNQADLFINGEMLVGSHHGTRYDRSEGEVLSLGSRSLYVRLEAGDTISLRTGQLGHGLFQITLCFQLAQFDYAPPV